MNRMTIRPRVSSDGMVRVEVPVGVAEKDREVDVTIEPAIHPRMSQREWKEFIKTTSGCITDPTFVRQDQGEFEHRENWS